MAKLTARQQMFIDEYLIDLNATQAAIRAGYSEKTAYSQGQRLLKNVEVHARIEEGKKTRADRLNLDAYWVLKRLMDISDRSMQAEQVMEFDYEAKELVPTGEYQFDSNGANRATELIGKHLGMFKDRVEVENVTPVFVEDVPEDDD
ncbi:terminase small subunit [Aquibacillus rhizosphaerae]|uniref:Terminase small subunit n=1 Tax=Aquibacillus rhizosphaerae TaxID=3051431 RepID=A0ABT7LBN5_9BACI|nr:terminase small subunit [Aquibacillus sp. LR5S19]MDL4842824.1 terminase small subunit [Aquibacillus sp. LR5S19]